MLCAMLAAAGSAAAQSGSVEGDPAAGEEIATNGVGNTVVACNFCHGNDGGGAEIKGIPYLAGLGSYYIGKQIDDYRSGARARHPVMQEVPNEPSAQQIADVVAYFAAIERVPQDPSEGADAALVSLGAQIAEIGDPERQIQACSNAMAPAALAGCLQSRLSPGNPRATSRRRSRPGKTATA
jgi:cytochrome c553